jgi:uncharacterized membrane protein (DUF2068 family)
LGITILSALQLIIGGVHVFFGFWLLTASQSMASLFSLEPSTIYSVYTIAFGFGTSILGYGIWLQRNWGAFGTIGLSLLVIIVDSLAVLDLPTIPGVPKFAALTEILYSIVVSAYLVQLKIKTNWTKSI